MLLAMTAEAATETLSSIRFFDVEGFAVEEMRHQLLTMLNTVTELFVKCKCLTIGFADYMIDLLRDSDLKIAFCAALTISFEGCHFLLYRLEFQQPVVGGNDWWRKSTVQQKARAIQS